MNVESSEVNNTSNLDSQDLRSELGDTNNSKQNSHSYKLQQVNLDYTTFDLVPHLVCVTDVDGSIKYVNRRWSEITGLRDIELLDSKLFDLVHPEERENFCRIWQESVTRSQPFEVELYILLDGEKYSWFLATGQPHFNTQGEVLDWVVSYTSIQKYKQAEQDFEKQNEFINALLANLSDGIVACDKNGNLTLFNQASIGFHGSGLKNIPPEQWAEYYDLYLPDGQTPMTQAEVPLFRVLQGESVRNVEMTIVPKQGNPRTLLASGDPIINPAGEKLGAVVAMHDITAQKQALKELRDRDTLLSSIYNGTEVSIFVIDVLEDGDFRYVGLNPAHERLTGISLQQIKNKTLEELLPSEVAKDIRQRYTNCVTNGETISYEENLAFNGDNTWWLTTLKPLRDVNNSRIYRIIGTSINITSRKQAEARVANLNAQLEVRVQQRTQELLEGEEKFRATFEQVAVGFAHVALDGRWLRVNQKLCEITGYSHEEILNLTFQDITHPDDLEADLNNLRRLLAGEIECYSMEKRYIRKDGSITWVEITPSLIRNSINNQPIYFIAVVEEIEERKHGQLQLQKKVEELARTNLLLTKTTAELHKRNQELDQFAYFASHDLKAPLRAIANLSQWLEDDLQGNLPPENQRQLELLRGRVNRMENLINGLLEYSRVGRVKTGLERINTNTLLKETIDLLEPESAFTIEIGSGMPTMTTKRLLLQQVFANLISNAIKHHPRKEGCINLSVNELEKFYEFIVSDDGAGISPEFHQKIFDIFQTLEARDTKENTGVGLAIVKKIIDSVGGSIKVESQLGQGAKFIFTWPKPMVSSM